MSPYVDPQMQVILDRLRAAPAVDFKAMPIARRVSYRTPRPSPGARARRRLPSRSSTIARRHASLARPPLPPRAGAASAPVIVFVHGGGWTFGSIDTHDGTMRNLAVAARLPGARHRLPPRAGAPVPGPLDDVLGAIAFVERGGLGDAACRRSPSRSPAIRPAPISRSRR